MAFRKISRFQAILFALLAAVLVVAPIALWPRKHDLPATTQPSATGSKSYAALVAANYKVLTRRQTRRLLRFADAFYTCMTERGTRLGRPMPLNTKIVLAIPPRINRQRLGRLVISCGDALGGPPADASLQSQQSGGSDAVELYLPKRCLLDRKVVSGRS
jgi:hypothetical protein